MTHYIGILDGGGDVWGVRVPDLPGCHGGGATAEAAISDAISAMREWAAEVAAMKQSVPAPRDLTSVTADPETDFDPAAERIIMLPMLAETARPVKANVSIDAGMLATIDAAAAARGMTRSAFLVAAARAMIERSAA
jgi:predicted RNase H-like HicB family nuclease